MNKSKRNSCKSHGMRFYKNYSLYTFCTVPLNCAHIAQFNGNTWTAIVHSYWLFSGWLFNLFFFLVLPANAADYHNGCVRRISRAAPKARLLQWLADRVGSWISATCQAKETRHDKLALWRCLEVILEKKAIKWIIDFLFFITLLSHICTIYCSLRSDIFALSMFPVMHTFLWNAKRQRDMHVTCTCAFAVLLSHVFTVDLENSWHIDWPWPWGNLTRPVPSWKSIWAPLEPATR